MKIGNLLHRIKQEKKALISKNTLVVDRNSSEVNSVASFIDDSGVSTTKADNADDNSSSGSQSNQLLAPNSAEIVYRSRSVLDLQERIVTVTDYNGQDISVTLHEDPMGKWASGNGATLWDAAIVLTNYVLGEVLVSIGNSNCESNSKKSYSVLELGCGVGLPSIALAINGHASFATERHIAMDILNHNISLNRFDAVNNTVKYTVLPHGSSSNWHARSDFNVHDVAGSVVSIPVDWTEIHREYIDDSNSDTPIDCKYNTKASSRYSGSSNGEIYKQFDSSQWDFVIGADLVFPKNREVWNDLVLTLKYFLCHDSCRMKRGYFVVENRGIDMLNDFLEVAKSRDLLFIRKFSTRIEIPNDIFVFEFAMQSDR